MQLQGRSYLGRYFRVVLSSSSQNSKTRWVLIMLKELETTVVETQKFTTWVFRVEFSIHWVFEFQVVNFWVWTTVSSSCNSTKTHRVFEFWKLELDSALQNRYLTTKSLYLYSLLLRCNLRDCIKKIVSFKVNDTERGRRS